MTTVLITGASSGIGRVTALRLAKKRYRVIGTGRSSTRLQKLSQDAEKIGLNIETIQIDLNSFKSTYNAFESGLLGKSGIDVLVNNAGFGMWGPLETLSHEEMQAQFQTNLFGLMELTRLAIPQLRASDKGQIINISSILGRIGAPFNGAYVASKFAVEGLSESLRLELSPFGISVSIVEPGNFVTEFEQNQILGRNSESTKFPYSELLHNYRTRRRLFDWAANPEKVAKVIEGIIKSSSPKLRYVVGLDARLALIARQVLPEKLFFHILKRMSIGD
ncbi:uncharacterized protein METZ01_LOCUS95273 [marine metagenome]|uniref:Short-chain dehydrogenase/reductase SDR n=1 Tax=marine metagenome TaxID=408172 RepID=A0A381VQ38_9ZZZZ